MASTRVKGGGSPGATTSPNGGTSRWWRTPLDAGQLARPRGLVQLTREWCKGCQYCVELCPTDVLTLSKDFNVKGYHYPEITLPDACVDCKLCERICPEYAIVVASRLIGPAGTPAPAMPDHSRTPTPAVVDST